MSFITYTDYYIPNNKISINDLVHNVDSSLYSKNFSSKEEYIEFINNILKLKSIRTEEELSPDEMLFKLIHRALDNKAFHPEDIDLIIIAQDERKWNIPNIGHFIQSEYKMMNAYPLVISGNQCTNFEQAFYYSNLIQNANLQMKNILVLGTAIKHKYEERIIDSYAIDGDGAGLMLISRDAKKGIKLLDHEITCNGKLYMANLNIEGDSLAHCSYTMKSIQTLVERNNLNEDKVDKILIHNANPLLASQCLLSCGFNQDKIFFDNLGSYGHIDQLDYLINIHDYFSGSDGVDTKDFISFGFGRAGTYLTMYHSIVY